jgi:hypothetical protein
MADNRAIAMRYLLGKGLTRQQAAGVVGSLMQESGLSPTITNRSSGAYGIGQWLGGRKTNLLNSGKSGLRGQLDFLWGELQGPENAALKRLKGAHSVADAVDAFTWGFERPGRAEANIPNRVNQARAALGLGGGGGGGGGGGADPTTTTETHLKLNPAAVAQTAQMTLPERPKLQVTAPVDPAFAAKAPTASAPTTGPPAVEPQEDATQAPVRFDAGAALEALTRLARPNPVTTTTTTTTATPSGGGGYPTSGQKGSKVLELIYNDGGQGFGIKNGQDVNGPQFYSGVWAGHANHVHVAAGPKTVVALGKLAQSMGLHVGENPHFGGVDPVHVAGSYHYKGEAIDVSGRASDMKKFARAVERYNRTHRLPG